MNKLQLSDIACYLPYGIKVQFTDSNYKNHHGINMLSTGKLLGFNIYKESDTIMVSVHSDNGIRHGLLLSEIKPLLRPLSALYEEIDGEMPADILFPKEYYSLIDFYEEHNRENQIKSFMNDGLKWCEPLDFWEYLFSKHFDVYSLIDKGLAIDKRSVK